MKQKIRNLHRTHRPHIFAASLVLLLITVIFGQLMYPHDRLLPFTRIEGKDVGWWKADDVVDGLHDQFSSVPLTVTIEGGKTIQTTSAKVGITPKYRQALERAHDYSLRERLIPFSFVYKNIEYSNSPLRYAIDDEILSGFMEEVTKACTVTPKDAGLKLQGETVTLDPAKAGQRCEKQSVKAALQGQDISVAKMKATVTPTIIKPARSNEDVQQQLTRAENIIATGLTIKSPNNETWPVPKGTLVSWLQVVETDGQLTIDTKQDEIKKFLDSLKGSLYKEPGVTRIVFRDGVEVAKQQGERGQGIDSEVTAQRVRTALLKESQPIAWVKLTVLEPKTEFDRSYSASNTGLQAMLEQWDKNNAGRYGIVVHDLSGKGVSANLNATIDFVPASTYKMFLAYAVLFKVQAGDISMDTTTDTGMSVRACIDEMILNSTNYCAVSLFNLVGEKNVHDFILAQGFSSTKMQNSASADFEKHTTAHDEADFLVRLHNGQLLDRDNTAYLLGLMKRQVYRSGIPKGVSGTTVANKVGFYDSYKHDAA
ncbi:hypothetical protein CYG49_04795, partial [Candidatus Saccharibacteria bacterium]